MRTEKRTPTPVLTWSRSWEKTWCWNWHCALCRHLQDKNKQKTINDKLKQGIVAASLHPHSNKYILKTKQHWQSIHKKDKRGFLVSCRLVLFSTAEDKFNTQVRAETSSWGLLTDTEVNTYILFFFSWLGYGGGGWSGGGCLNNHMHLCSESTLAVEHSINQRGSEAGERVLLPCVLLPCHNMTCMQKQGWSGRTGACLDIKQGKIFFFLAQRPVLYVGQMKLIWVLISAW